MKLFVVLLVVLLGGCTTDLSSPISSAAAGSASTLSRPAAGEWDLNDFVWITGETRGREEVHLAWEVHEINTRYAIYRDGKLLAVKGKGASFVDRSVPAGVHLYEVVELNISQGRSRAQVKVFVA